MRIQLAVFAVDGDEISRARQVEHKFQLFLAGVSGNVRRPLALVVDSGAAAAEMIHQARDGAFVARDDSGADDDGIAFLDCKILMLAKSQACQRRQGFSLASGTQNNLLVVGKRFGVCDICHNSGRYVQITQIRCDGDVFLHAPADGNDAAAKISAQDPE